MNIRVICILLIISLQQTFATAQLDGAESCPAPDTERPSPSNSPPEDASTSVCVDLPGSTEDWGRVLKQLKIFLKQLSQARQLIGTKHFISELITTLKLPGAKNQWIKLFEDISLEEIFDNISFGGFRF